jgi:hypothetical protein
VEIVGRRARIIDPVEGWVSITTVYDEPIMGLTIPPDKKTQVRTMNRRFDKLKQEQALKGGASSPIAAPMIHRTGEIQSCNIMDSPKEQTPVESLKKKIVFKSSITPAGEMEATKPLAGPPRSGIKSAPVVDLLDFGSPVTSGIATPNEVSPQETPKQEQCSNLEIFSLI